MTRALPLSALLWAACEGVTPGIDFQQMIHQSKYQAYEASSYFSDGRTMQPPPLGTVPRDRILHRPELTEGVVKGDYVSRVPLPVTRALVELGRSRFDVYCATCHGFDGSGESEVARHMEKRRPPPLIHQPVLGFPPGRIYQVIAEGYGLMPSYAQELSIEERWAIVAYLPALQVSQSISIEELPAAERQAAQRALGRNAP
jgi:mono/diheme cytochrome c family protein